MKFYQLWYDWSECNQLLAQFRQESEQEVCEWFKRICNEVSIIDNSKLRLETQPGWFSDMKPKWPLLDNIIMVKVGDRFGITVKNG